MGPKKCDSDAAESMVMMWAVVEPSDIMCMLLKGFH
jgi:hypothetical protein